jgi:hypothetical protein
MMLPRSTAVEAARYLLWETRPILTNSTTSPLGLNCHRVFLKGVRDRLYRSCEHFHKYNIDTDHEELYVPIFDALGFITFALLHDPIHARSVQATMERLSDLADLLQPERKTLREVIALFKERGKHGPCPDCGGIDGQHADDCELVTDTELEEKAKEFDVSPNERTADALHRLSKLLKREERLKAGHSRVSARQHGPCPECGALNGEHTDDCQLEVDTELVEEGGGS